MKAIMNMTASLSEYAPSPLNFGLSNSRTTTGYPHQHIMVLARIQPPLRATLKSIGRSGASQTSLSDAFAQLTVRGPLMLTFVRHASHAQQGAVNKAKDGPGKRLGAKKSGGMICEAAGWLEMPETNLRRAICDPGQHYLPSTRHSLVPRR